MRMRVSFLCPSPRHFRLFRGRTTSTTSARARYIPVFFRFEARAALKCPRASPSTRSWPPSWRFWPTRRWRRSASSWTAGTRCCSWRSRGAARRTRRCVGSCGSRSCGPRAPPRSEPRSAGARSCRPARPREFTCSRTRSPGGARHRRTTSVQVNITVRLRKTPSGTALRVGNPSAAP